ncbi:helix-turn-helix domain-containing protein [Enterobacter hormaechei subsp. steigerwaltii]|jgi:Ner family transcriptional regulator|uniref:Helix-turn-helix domain-containing protein n=3 Tax=Enterobacter TaxID=547 RepID=A0A7T0DWY2_9ENTR|nr:MULTISPECIES: helix-turn-helix transcriptional regulator [Enterobacteriaceae]ELK6490095.1 helix-turn-helix domain-containing protein [Enterobacter bugandensis]ELY3732084.1 helix-turn-helix domain-containing protein [Cronobacter sakazakii]MDU4484200.1 helix-turn-helix transcriptional regulator [Enterobacter sp.]HDT5205848.1 helix-turn-helix domain-containing protein [Klebsiella quasipneumoniae subsp. similipneumoniae]AUJ83196.1 transcriptional regulator [Enterobacter cancerogenus]
MKNHKQEGSQKKESNASTRNWHRADVLAAIRKKGSSLAKLSRDNGLHERTLYNALERHWPKGEKIIADYIGVTREEIWPERYSNSEE